MMRSPLRCLMIGCLFAGSIPFAGQAFAQSDIDVGLQDGLLTLRTQATPADELAAALHDATGIDFIVTGESGTPLSADIVDEPLDKAIAQLSPNHMLVRENERPDAAIIEVVMMMPDATAGGTDSVEFLPSGAPADGVDGNAMPGGPEDLQFDENGMPVDPAQLRDAGRADQLGELQPAREPGLDPTGQTIDQSGFQPDPDIDPATGELRQP